MEVTLRKRMLRESVRCDWSETALVPMHMQEGFPRVPIKYLEYLSLFQGDEALIFRARTKFRPALTLASFILLFKNKTS
jgi:hypothetical protein